MIHIKRYESLESTLYKGLYVTPIAVDKTFCHIIQFYDEDTKRSIKEICEFINTKYKDILVVEMAYRPQSGIIIKDGNIESIANEVHELYKKTNLKSLSLNRVVYGEGEMDVLGNDIHTTWGKLVIELGTYSDSKKGEYGVFKSMPTKRSMK